MFGLQKEVSDNDSNSLDDDWQRIALSNSDRRYAMDQFHAGKVIQTPLGIPVKIIRYLAGGGQGDVYEVEFNGEHKALKWYRNPKTMKNPKLFYDNLKRNASKGSPDKAFLWPITVTEIVDGSFGYVMDLRPDSYHELSEFMLGQVGFTSFKAATEACIRIVSAFRILHNSGRCYQDMNDGNFFIEPKSGKVLICDNDNVAENNTETFIVGTPRYIAPEIVLGTAEPSTQTDRFSLAVVLFMILCMNHPLEGKHWLVPCLTPEVERKLYGSAALFIYDKDDDSNRPAKGVHNNVIKRWGYMPTYIQDAFLTAFGKEAIREPGRRLRELDWLKVLVRFQSDIVRCQSCGNEVFIADASSTPCDKCGQILDVSNTLKVNGYSVTAAKGTRIYRCQLGSCNADQALMPIGQVVASSKNPKALGFRNVTDQVMIGVSPSGKKNQVKPGDVVPLKAGIKLEVYDCTMCIE